MKFPSRRRGWPQVVLNVTCWVWASAAPLWAALKSCPRPRASAGCRPRRCGSRCLFGGNLKGFFFGYFGYMYCIYCIYICILYIYAVGHSRIYFFGAPRWMPDRSRLYRSRTNIPLNMPTWAWAEQLHAPAQCLKARSRLCRFRTNTPLKHTNMSVSSTAAPSPLNTWQPDHVYAAF